MELVARHRFEASTARVIEALACPAYAAHLAASHSFFAQVEPLEQLERAHGWQRRVHYRAQPFITRLGVFSLPTEWFAWEEHSTYEAGLLQFENVPLLASVRDKVINRGAMRFAQDAYGTTREAHFEIDFRVAAMYRPLKEMALAMVRRQLIGALDEEAALLAGWLARADSPTDSVAA
ncbi:MAG TPA: hypothetical protein VFX59_09560 [Polyangiales bacterium]|nr:hypothetical protein [Polyangiales bacterium]